MTNEELEITYKMLKKADRLDVFVNYTIWARECLELVKKYNLEGEDVIEDSVLSYLDEKEEVDKIYDYILEKEFEQNEIQKETNSN